MATLRPCLLMLATPLVCLSLACSETKDLVVVSAGPPMTDCVAPDIVYQAKDGKPVSVNATSAPLKIIAFVRTGGCDSHWIDPRLIPLAIQFRDLPVSVVQISLPCVETSGEPMVAGMPADADVAVMGNQTISQAQALMPAGDYTCNGTQFNERLAAEVLRMVPICDVSKAAWNAFGRPTPDWAYLVDDSGRIVDAAPLDDMTCLAYHAHVLADQHRGECVPPENKRLEKLCCLAVVWCAPWNMRSQYTPRTPGGCPLGGP